MAKLETQHDSQAKTDTPIAPGGSPELRNQKEYDDQISVKQALRTASVSSSGQREQAMQSANPFGNRKKKGNGLEQEYPEIPVSIQNQLSAQELQQIGDAIKKYQSEKGSATDKESAVNLMKQIHKALEGRSQSADQVMKSTPDEIAQAIQKSLAASDPVFNEFRLVPKADKPAVGTPLISKTTTESVATPQADVKPATPTVETQVKSQRQQEAEQQQIAEQKARQLEQARLASEQQAARLQAEQARIQAAEQAKLRAEQEAKRAAEEAARRKAEQAQKEAQMIAEVRAAAKGLAGSHHDDSPNYDMSPEEYKRNLEKLIAKHKPNQEMLNKMQNEFLNQYASERQALFDDMNWVKRGYYSFTSWCSDKVDQLKAVGQKILDTAEAVVDGAVKVGKGVAKLAVKTYEAVRDADWEKIADKTLELAGKAYEALKDPETYIKAGEMLVNGVVVAGKAIGTAAYNVVTDPVGSLKATGKFLKGMSDSIGLTDAAYGFGCAFIAPFEYGYDVIRTGGDFEVANANYMKNMDAAKDGLIGGAKCFCEVTGVADAYHCARCYGKALILYGEDREMEAAFAAAEGTMHLAFAAASIGSITATVATGGAAVGTIAAVAMGRTAMKEGLKQIAKAGLKQLGKEMGEQVLESASKELVQKASQELVENTVKESVEATVKEVTAQGAKALTPEAVQRVTAEVAETNAKKFMTESGLDKQITKAAEELFQKMEKEGVRGNDAIAKQLMESGVPKSEAKRMANEASKAFRSGATDKEVIEALTKEVSDKITKEVEERTAATFKTQYRQALEQNDVLAKAIKEQAEAAGKTTAKYTDELVEAASKGYREGLEKGIREATEQALKKALAKHRFAKHMSGSGEGAGIDPMTAEDVEVDEKHAELVLKFCRGEKESVELKQEQKSDTLQEKRARVIQRDGNLIRVEFYILEGQEVITAQDVIATANKEEAQQPKNIIQHDFSSRKSPEVAVPANNQEVELPKNIVQHDFGKSASHNVSATPSVEPTQPTNVVQHDFSQPVSKDKSKAS